MSLAHIMEEIVLPIVSVIVTAIGAIIYKHKKNKGEK